MTIDRHTRLCKPTHISTLVDLLFRRFEVSLWDLIRTSNTDPATRTALLAESASFAQSLRRRLLVADPESPTQPPTPTPTPDS